MLLFCDTENFVLFGTEKKDELKALEKKMKVKLEEMKNHFERNQNQV